MATLSILMSIVPAIAAAICTAVLAAMVTSKVAWAMDVPGERSLHTAPTPRTGGIAMAVGVIGASACSAALGGDWRPIEGTIALALCITSLLDDRHGLPIGLRLSAHLAAAAAYGLLLFLPALPPQSHPVLFGICILAIAGMTNFYNFMDGANGLSGGMTAIGFGCYALAAGPVNPELTMLCLAIAGAAIAFLAFNLRGRIFMGDCGSIPTGFLASTVGISGWLTGAWPIWFPLIVFSPFIVDAGSTLLRRMFRGERFWEAHREHYYQRIVRMGCSHVKLAGGAYVLMVGCGAAALIARTLPDLGRWALFATIALSYLALMRAIDIRWATHRISTS